MAAMISRAVYMALMFVLGFGGTVVAWHSIVVACSQFTRRKNRLFHLTTITALWPGIS